MKTKTAKVSAPALDGSVRSCLSDGLIHFSKGITALPEKDQLAIIRCVRTFDDFTPENGERDFGSFTHNGRTICWKLDYLDAILRVPRRNVIDHARTPRVVCVMLADER
jgi:Protein of unknown function (DUF3768)